MASGLNRRRSVAKTNPIETAKYSCYLGVKLVKETFRDAVCGGQIRSLPTSMLSAHAALLEIWLRLRRAVLHSVNILFSCEHSCPPVPRGGGQHPFRDLCDLLFNFFDVLVPKYESVAWKKIPNPKIAAEGLCIPMVRGIADAIQNAFYQGCSSGPALATR
jgi:hypothetical protein